MQPLLQWEIRAYADYINPQMIAKQLPRNIIDIKGLLSAAPAIAAAAQFGIPITVNQLRSTFGLSCHPDSTNGVTGATPVCPYGDISQGVTVGRGDMLIGATDISETTDNTIPIAFKQAFTAYQINWGKDS